MKLLLDFKNPLSINIEKVPLVLKTPVLYSHVGESLKS